MRELIEISIAHNAREICAEPREWRGVTGG
jgi:hypothetical protein